MRKFERHTGVAVPLVRDNVDTDAIIPSREMKRVSKTGLGVGLFAAWRYADKGRDKSHNNAEFVLNQAGYQGASILLGGTNFGCGSSREHAVWALDDYGFRVLLAPSFGAIFKRNCARNGILAVELPAETIATLADYVAVDPATRTLTVDLVKRQIEGLPGRLIDFEIGDDARRRLLAGADDIDLTLEHARAIEEFKAKRYVAEPWAELVTDIALTSDGAGKP